MVKAILVSSALTATAITFAASIFLNPLLGAFGLVATSVGTLQSLRASHQIVEQLQERHKRRKAGAHKKVAKRTARRVAAGAAAAATVGTIAVAITMTSLAINDYCEEQVELQKEAKILFGALENFDFAQCLEEGKRDSQAILSEAKAMASSALAEAMDVSVESGSRLWSRFIGVTEEALAATSEESRKFLDSVKNFLYD